MITLAIVIALSFVLLFGASVRRRKRNRMSALVRAPALQDAILHQVCGYIAPPRPGPDHRPVTAMVIGPGIILLSAPGRCVRSAQCALLTRRKVTAATLSQLILGLRT
jgi:hypothetical protein